MASLSRRSVIVNIGGIVCAGCTGSDESSPTLEYGLSDLQGADEVPDGVVEHPNPDGFRWIEVRRSVTNRRGNVGPDVHSDFPVIGQ